MIGQIIDGKWEVLRSIKQSNFGHVFEGRHLPSNEPCAIKVLISGTTNAERLADFEVEGNLLELLDGCSNIINLFDRGRHQIQAQVRLPGGGTAPIQIEYPYLVLELADASLADLIAHRHQVPWKDRLALFREVVKGIHQMHLERVVNRDVKSDNVLILQPSPKRTDAKIADLGRSSNTRSPARVVQQAYEFMRGDPAFSAPELIWGLGDASPDTARLADLYLIGSVLFEFGAGVGLTAIAVRSPMTVMRGVAPLAPADRQREYAANLSQLRQEMELGYAQFEAEVPRTIRQPAMELLRLLTDVDPEAREPTTVGGKPLAVPWDLQWLLRKVDIMLRLLAVRQREEKRKQLKAARRAKQKGTGSMGTSP